MLNTVLIGAFSSLLFAGCIATSNEIREIVHPRQVIYPQFLNATNNSTSDVQLQISTTGGGRNATAPLLYGWMFEDISVRTM